MSCEVEMRFHSRRKPTMMCRVISIATILVVIVQCSCNETLESESVPVNPKQHQSSTPTDSSKDHYNEDSNAGLSVVDFHNSSFLANDTVSMKTPTKGLLQTFGMDIGAVKRTFYVVATLTGVVLLYFTFKGIRTMRRRRRKPRRYGLLADSKEMKQFRDEEDDDSDVGDEDATLFDARKHKSTNKRGP